MKPIDLCEAGALQPFVNCMQRRGLEVEHYLEQQWISPAQVDSGEGKIIKRQAWKMFEEVQRREGLDLEARVPDHFTIVVLSSVIRMAAGEDSFSKCRYSNCRQDFLGGGP